MNSRKQSDHTYETLFFLIAFHFNGTHSLQATLQQFEALDLDTFRIVNVDFNMVFMRMDFHFHYAQLRSNGNFRQAVGRSPGNCAIYGNGGFAVRANNVNYFMSSRLVLRGGTLEMGEMTTRITFGSFNSNVVSFVGTQAQSAQCNTMLEQRMPAIMAAGEPQISRYFENVFRPIANSFIRGMTLQDLLNIITAPSNPVPWCRAAAPATADVAVEDVVADEPEPEHTL